MNRDREVFKGRLLRLWLKRVRLPNGFTVDLEVIRHPGAALVVPFVSPGRVVLIRQFRPVIGAYLYELPAGTLNRGESTVSCARREIIEETGFRARRLKRLGIIYPVPGYSTERITVYSAHGLTKGARAAEDDEVISTRIVTRGEVLRLFRRGRIVDAKTICGLSMCGWLNR